MITSKPAVKRLGKYLVTWQIDVEATGPKDAARQARMAQDPGTEALYFEVTNTDTDVTHTVDLENGVVKRKGSK
jgi:hypothetical protein